MSKTVWRCNHLELVRLTHTQHHNHLIFVHYVCTGARHCSLIAAGNYSENKDVSYCDTVFLCCSSSARVKPGPAPTSSALMHSDSDLDSDDGQGGVPWTEQERGHLLRPQNGSLRNGQGPARGKKQREELL